MGTGTLFLHGLDSSGNGTKGQFFARHFPDILRPDFTGNLEERLAYLEELTKDMRSLTFIGSSFGGLMGTCFALKHPEKIAKLILLAPALNFGGYRPPAEKLQIPTLLVIGKDDIVCPPDPVVPLAEATFAELETRIEEDDHLLHNIFPALDWEKILNQSPQLP